jgi:glucan phosphoethanolaminetransferase (alkaline phosphatase superfamily)
VRFYLLLVSPFLAFVWLELLHLAEYGDFISIGAVAATLETNRGEAGEFFASHLSYLYGFAGTCVVYFLILVTRVKRGLRVSLRGKAALAVVAALVFAASTGIGGDALGLGHGEFRRYLRRSSPVSLANGVYYFWKERRAFERAIERRAEFTFQGLSATPLREREIVVLIIGETSRAANWSLYGYGRETSPELAGIAESGGVVVFSDVVSQAVLTRASVSMMLTRARPSQLGPIYGERSLLSAFGQAGYSTFWVSNQEKYGVFNTLISAIANEADQVEFLSQNRSYRTAQRSEFDEALIPRLDEILRSDAEKILIVLHTMGSHFDYHNRYPKKYRVFTPTREDLGQSVDASKGSDIRSQVEINGYDNSILYTDHFVASVIERVDRETAASAVVFLSDHGENLGDDDRHRWGHGLSEPTVFSIHIPFIVWVSEDFRSLRPRQYEGLIANRDKPFSLDYLFYTMIDLGGISIGGEVRSRSAASPEMELRDRMILTPDNRVVDVSSIQ